MRELTATILLPNCRVWDGNRCDGAATKGAKCPLNKDFLGQHVTRTDAHKRISSAGHSTNLQFSKRRCGQDRPPPGISSVGVRRSGRRSLCSCLLRQDRHSIQVRIRTLLGIGGRQDRGVRSWRGPMLTGIRQGKSRRRIRIIKYNQCFAGVVQWQNGSFPSFDFGELSKAHLTSKPDRLGERRITRRNRGPLTASLIFPVVPLKVRTLACAILFDASKE